MRYLIGAGLVLLAAAAACGDDEAAPGNAADADGGAAGTGDSGTSSSGGADAGGTDGDVQDLPVSRCGKPKPGPTNTGVPAGTTLEKSKTIKVNQAGAVIEDLDIDGEIEVYADNVTIRRVKITTGSYYPIRYDPPRKGLVVEDSEIIGTSDDVTAAVSFEDYTARRLNVHGMADGLKANANVLIEDCWIHDLRNGPDQHNDGVQSTGGKGVTLRNNSISGASNACVQTGDEGVATEDLTVECNWLSGGGYTLNIRGKGSTRPKNTKIIDNRFGKDHGYGPWTLDDPNPTIRGNVYDEDGSAIPDDLR